MNFFVELTELVLEAMQPEKRPEQTSYLVRIGSEFMTTSLTTVAPVAFEPRLGYQ